MRKLLLAAALLAVALAPNAVAEHYSNFYVIPYASHVPASFDYDPTEFGSLTRQSDLYIQNFQSTPLSVELTAIQYGLHNLNDNIFPLDTVTVPANGSVRLVDYLRGARNNAATIAAILVGSTDGRPFAVVGRSYFVRPDGGTIGYSVPGIANFLENSTGDVNNTGATAYLPGIMNNSQFRTDFGFVVGTGVSAAFVEFTIRNAGGGIVGERDFFIPEGVFAQYQIPLDLVDENVDEDNVDTGSIEARISAGDAAVIPYAIVMDRITGDAMFIVGQFPPTTPFSKRSLGTSLFEGLLKRTGAAK